MVVDTTENLAVRWQCMWSRINAAGSPWPVYDDLVTRYSENHRRYHTLAHIEHCFSELDKVWYLAHDVSAVELGIWFHDAVYDTRAKDNEEKSARLALDFLTKAGFARRNNLAIHVVRNIKATTHRSMLLKGDASLIVDIDLAILGQSEEVFDAYERQIREEYAWVPEEIFRVERKKILESILWQGNPYHTTAFREKYGRQAEMNLRRSIKAAS